MNLRGRKIFVTGATGFIGGRLVEKLILEEGADVVALVRNFKSASRLARFPVKMIGGDVLDEACLAKAMDGCSAVIHCAVDGSGTPEQNRRVSVEGARNICQAAKKLGVQRMVHLSTISVYGRTAPGVLDELAPKSPHPDPYGMVKLEAENVVLDFAKSGVPCTVLQPTVVYGPWSHWTVSTAQLLGTGKVILPDNGEGRCNAVYVDDVANAIFCACRSTQSIPGPYLISAEASVAWADYYRAYMPWIPESSIEGEPFEKMEKKFARQQLIGSIAPTFFSDSVRLKISKMIRKFPSIWQAYNAGRGKNTERDASGLLRAFPLIKPDPNRHVSPPQGNIRFMALRSDASIKKAQDELGYQPQFDLARAMQQVGPWLQWAGFAPR